MKGKEEAMTLENFDPDKYADGLREQGYRDDAIPDLIEKKKVSLQKIESDFEYILKLETVDTSDDSLIIAGFASSGSLDHDSEAINQESLKVAFNEYMKNPVLRYMHGQDVRNPDAIGRVLPEYVKSNGETIKTEFIDGKPFIVAKLSSATDIDSIRTKIKEGVLTGFSVGGKANRVSEFCTRLGKNINRIHVSRLNEISVVDLPANKETFFEVIKNECVGNNCNCDINNYDEIVETISEDENTVDKINKLEEMDMSENIEMEIGEFRDLVKSTVSEMITEQDTVEKVEGYDAAIAQVVDLKARIEELEAKVKAQAEQLKAAPEETMKSETVVEEIVETETVEDDRVAKLEAKLTEMMESPMYKAKQEAVVEKTEITEQGSFLSGIIKENYGGQ